ncbi:MAG: hypothetical protein JXB48_00130 [Candidatus Latescibacteria bacterium]|nr:hypothetical protein [Candidatus Latescibacterota bacterium]
MNLRFIAKIIISTLFCMIIIIQIDAQNPDRLKREDSFLGIHFDFHAGYDCNEIGKTVTPEMIERVIDQVHPDYIQCDCKGHAGISSYPTKVGHPAPGFVRDQLRIWRDVTARRGVALYMHYSGVWDSEAVKNHPEWARINEKGETDNRLTSVYGPYVDKLLIPQIEELIDEYNIDGIWIDGECWAVERDYGENVIRKFREKTGITTVPRNPEDPYYFEFTEFNRDGFRNYFNHYVTEIHKHAPDFQIAGNWAYSSLMPEPAVINVDFISGDFSARNSVNAGRLEGRAMVHQGKPWDLMAWSFTWDPGIYSTKSIAQLKREAATVIALGGGFQAYFPQNRDGSVRQWEWDMNLMGEIAKFCRERQEFCHKAEPVPQIGLLYSGSALYRINDKMFSSWKGELNPMKGILQSLLDSQNSVEIVMEHHLTGRMLDYPLIVMPEWEYLEPKFKSELIAYVNKGGNLLIIGPKAAALFESELGVKLVGEPESKIKGLAYEERLAGMETISQDVKLGDDVKAFGRLYANARNDMTGPYQPAASIKSYGKGKIAAAYINLGDRYLNARTSVACDFLNGLVRELFPDPIVMVSGSHTVDVVVNRINGNLAVNLVNTSGPHESETVRVFDEIDPVGPLVLSIAHDRKPRNVTVQPGDRKTEYDYKNGRISLTLPRLEIHDIIIVE